ncbi:MAG: Nif3-like dinuclear metal center hexameric protein [Clostridia bacterium]|nr:Nif3-like dinuclear metal center hexameric protein [Clostridia bacterium]
MTVKTLYESLSERIPASLSLEWDHDGLAVCPDLSAPVRKVLCVLDVTDYAITYAKENGFDVILAHHPMFMRGLGAVTEETFLGRRALACVSAGISVMTFHTRADAVEGGVNDCLLRALGLQPQPMPCENNLLRFGRLAEAQSVSCFARTVKEALGAECVRYCDSGKSVSLVAVCGGGGKDFAHVAKASGADLYLTGELNHHILTDGKDDEMSYMDAGHFETEYPVLAFFAEQVKDICPQAEVECLRLTPFETI